MQDYNQPDRNQNQPHLTVVNPQATQETQKNISDRSLLRRFLAQYRQTGQCQTLPQLIEIARLARQRQLISPKEARILLADLAEIESNLPIIAHDLTILVAAEFSSDIQPINRPEKGLELIQKLTKIGEYLDELMAIARNHPNPEEPGVKEGFAPCYMDTIKQVNDLRYDLAYLREHLLPQSMAIMGDRSHHAHLQINTILDVINHLYSTAMALLFRVRENISRFPKSWLVCQ